MYVRENYSGDDLLKFISRKDKPVAVEFWAEWCGPCKMYQEAIDKVGSKMEDEITFVRVNIDKNPQLIKMFEVRGIPTISICINREEIGRKIGCSSEEALGDFVKETIRPKKALRKLPASLSPKAL